MFQRNLEPQSSGSNNKKPDLKVCDAGTLVTNIMFQDIIRRPDFIYKRRPFLLQNTTFRRLDSVSVFR
jgi:hypothetical protein